jgi:hypothetical protein
MTSAGFNRRMRKTACPVVWKEHGAKSPCSHPITKRRCIRMRSYKTCLRRFLEEQPRDYTFPGH